MKFLKSLFVIAIFLVFATCFVHSHPDAEDASIDDDDATIQNNPNYAEPSKENVTVSDDTVGVEEPAKVADEEEDVKKETSNESEVSKEIEDEETIPDLTALEDDLDEFDSDNDYDDDEDEYDFEEADEVEAAKTSRKATKKSAEATKRILAQALSKSRTAPRYAIKFAKKNRVKLTIAAALFAFRKEIRRVLYLAVTKPKTIDPETGRVLSRTINISPTSVIKILLFLDLMRKLQSGESPDAGPLGPKGSFLFKLLHPSNNAFVPPIEQHWTFERVNERYEKDSMAFEKAMGTQGTALGVRKKSVAQPRRSFKLSSILGIDKEEKEDLVILMDWTKLPESLGEQMSSLRDQVSFLLSQHRSKNGVVSPSPVSNVTSANVTETTEIVVLLESPGGAAADYGLAAQMMLRLCHEPGIVVTVCVDKVAASGGYMIACASSPGRLFGMFVSTVPFIVVLLAIRRILYDSSMIAIAAPFSVLGSIGVVGTAININNVLQGWGVRPLVFRGGKNKAPVGLIGEVTKDGIKQVQMMVC